MIKSITLALLGVLALAALAQANALATQRLNCIKQSASYLAGATIDSSVSALVSKARQFYSDILTLIRNDDSDALLNLSGQEVPAGCGPLEQHVGRLAQAVPCYMGLELESDDMSTLDVAQTSAGARDVLEAHFACVGARD